MKVSYAILVHDEHEEIDRLLSKIEPHLHEEDEIVVVWDEPSSDEEAEKVEDVLSEYSIAPHYRELEDNFADQKNFLNDKCEGDWIFNIDADEYPSDHLLKNLHTILNKMDDDGYELLLIPRVNTVEGLTQDHIDKWGWRVGGKDNWVNWPDMQWRLYKNNDEIKWIHPVHEKIVGFEKYGALPAEEKFALHHPKTIEKQEKQNEFYQEIIESYRD